MSNDDSSVTYKVGSTIRDAAGGYYDDFQGEAPSLFGTQAWAAAVACAHKVDADQLALVAPPSS